MGKAKISAPPAHFLNREFSWLEFNARVLAMAESPAVPLLERLKFAAITASNLDEFFMVRVAEHRNAVANGTSLSATDGLSSREVLAGIASRCRQMFSRLYHCLDHQLLPALTGEGIHLLRPDGYSAGDRQYLERYFREELLPILTPLAVDPGHPFPLLASGTIYILFKVTPAPDAPATGASATGRGRFFQQTDTILVQAPAGLPRFVRLPGPPGQLRVAILNDIITRCAEELLGGYHVEDAFPFRVLRDASLEPDESAGDLISALEEELKSRRWGAPVRLEIPAGMPAPLSSLLCARLGLEEEFLYPVPSLLDPRCLTALAEMVQRPDLRDPPWPAHPPAGWSAGTDIFGLIRRRDVILHHPYQSFDPVIQFIASAARDPDVLAIKMTLYRVSGDSPIVRALIHAAETGKQVTVLVELQARFDEEANIAWARRLSSAGAHVIYGVVGYKTHAKACLVVRREKDGIRRYVHLATGNYNDRTARLYTDLGLFTARPAFGADISAFFNVITGYSLPPRFHHIVMAPTDLRDQLRRLITREMEKSTPETPGLIEAKMNSLTDPELIQALYRASAAGVQIRLTVRGICRLRAGLAGLSANIEVRSIVDRFLEHSRIFHFRNGGHDEWYLSSADWMERNMDHRLELLFPVLDPALQEEVAFILEAGRSDNRHAWMLQPDGTYRREQGAAQPRRNQELLYQRADRLADPRVSSRQTVFRVRQKPV